MRLGAMAWSLLLFSLFLVASPVEGSSPTFANPRLELSWCDGEKLYPFALSPVKREVEAVFALVEVPVRWETCPAQEPSPHPDAVPLRIVLLGSQSAGPGWNLTDALGAVVSDGGAVDSIYIFVPQLKSLFGLKAGQLPRPRTLQHLSRALARVISHEIVHAVIPGGKHASSGLMRAHLSRSILIRRRTRMDAQSAAAFVNGLAARTAGMVRRRSQQ